MNSEMDIGLLERGLEKLSLSPTELQKERWKQHLQLLLKWNKTYNLTAITSFDDGISLHLLDSLSIAPFLNGTEILDVGTGGGFPGIPLAILFPNKRFTLVDSSAKKVRYLRQVVLTLGLTNVVPLHGRVEKIAIENKAECIVSRAFSSLELFIALTENHLAENGLWLAMKGKLPNTEIEVIKNSYDIAIHPLSVPNAEVERHLITIRRSL